MTKTVCKILSIAMFLYDAAHMGIHVLTPDTGFDKVNTGTLCFQHNIINFLQLWLRLLNTYRSGHIGLVALIGDTKINRDEFMSF